MDAQRAPIDVTDVDLGGDIVIITDGDGTIVDINDAFVSATGFSRTEAIGASPRLLNSGLQAADIYEDLWRTVQAGEVWSGELVDRHRDGSLRTHQVTMSPILGPDGQVAHIVAIQRDLTAADAYRGAITGVGALHTDRDSRCVYVDAEAARLFGGATQELYAAGWQRLLHDEDVVAVTECVTRAVESEQEQRTDVHTRAGKWLHLLIDPRPSSPGRSPAIGTSWAVEDITERMESHARLARRDAVMTALLESFPEPVAVIESDGTIVAINPAWARGKRMSHPALASSVGDDLTAVLRRAAQAGSPGAAHLASELTSRLTGVPASTSAPELHGVRLTPLRTERGGLIVHLDDLT